MWSKDIPNHAGIYEWSTPRDGRRGTIRVHGDTVTRLNCPTRSEYDMATWVNIMSDETFYQEVA